MTRWIRFSIGTLWVIVWALLVGNAGAQQAAKSASAIRDSQRYDLARETSVQGAVISYTEAPFDAHLVLQMAAGPLDAYLGNAKLLTSNHVTLSPGDAIRVIGETVRTPSGTQFLARILVKGNQQVALRTVRGFPFVSSGRSTFANQANTAQGGVL